MIWTRDQRLADNAAELGAQRGPQQVAKHGEVAVAILSAQDRARLRGSELSIADFLLNSPLAGSEQKCSQSSELVTNLILEPYPR